MISIFTPFSKPANDMIVETYRSLLDQTVGDWEWVVLKNRGAVLPDLIRADKRVKVLSGDHLTGVGALKRECCRHAAGDFLLELDHDDLLHSSTLAKLQEAFDAGADFIYSDFAQFRHETWEPVTFGQLGTECGWESYPVEFQGHELQAMRAPEDPASWRRILWAPNHLRAWRASTYFQVPGSTYDTPSVRFIGGHDASLEFSDDHDLVMRTFLSGAKCVRIPECLYFYRVHESQQTNASRSNDRIQACAEKTYERHIYRLAEKLADDRGLLKVDLCGAVDCPEQYVSLDIEKSEHGVQCDLDGEWALEDNSVGVIRAFDALEHLRDSVHTMNEAYRVLAPGGFLLISVPSTDGKGAWCDPTHVSFWNDMSFRYYTDSRFIRYIKRNACRFQVSRIVNLRFNGIAYVQAELIALKDGYSPMGIVLC